MYLDEINCYLEDYKQQLIDDLVSLIKIPSLSSDNDNIQKALDFLVERSLNLGLKSYIIQEGDVCIIEAGKGEETLGILSHIDVVQADTETEDWKHEPFSGEVINGEIWGRGTVDDKGPLLACLYAIYFAKLTGKSINKKVQIIIGTQEEVNWTDMENYVKKYELPDYGFTPDGEFPVQNIEKGYCDIEFVFNKRPVQDTSKLEVVSIQAGEQINSVPAGAYAIIKNVEKDKIENYLNEFQQDNSDKISISSSIDGIKISTRGISTHACQPENGKNALKILCKFLSGLPLAENGFDKVVSFISDNFYDDIYGEKIGICDSSEYYKGEFIHKTIICPTLAGTKKDKIKITFNIRVTYGIGKDRFTEVLDLLCKKYYCSYNILDYKEPIFIERNKPYLKAMVDSYREVTGRDEDFLTAMGTSYAKAMPNIVSWGPVYPEGPDYCHEANERISIEELLNLVRIYGNYIWTVIFEEKSFK